MNEKDFKLIKKIDETEGVGLVGYEAEMNKNIGTVSISCNVEPGKMGALMTGLRQAKFAVTKIGVIATAPVLSNIVGTYTLVEKPLA